MTKLEIPAFSLIVMIGAAGSGKSSFCRTYFHPTEVLSSDVFRGLVSGDEASQEATADAFECLYLVLAKRLSRRCFTVLDATNVRPEDRRRPLEYAAAYQAAAIAFVMDTPIETCIARNRYRSARIVPDEVIRKQQSDLGVSPLDVKLRLEGFAATHLIRPEETIEITRRLTEPE